MRRRHHATTLVILAAATACGGGDLDEGPIGSVEQPVTVCPGATVVEGIDVSHWDGVIDWGKVAGAGKKFSVAKATQSTDFIDDKFVANWKGMKAAGVIRGAYHFFDFVTNPTAQADWFVDEIEKAGGLEPGDLPPTLDLEWNGNQQSSAKKVQEFLQRVEQRTCRRPMIYTSASFLDPLSPPAALAAYPVWIAHYTNGCPNTPALWSAWTFWQNSDKGVVAGIPAAAVDLDKFDGSLADLQAFASEVTCGGAGGAGQGGGGAGGGGQGACPTWIGAAGAVLEEDGPCATLSGKVYQSTDGHAGHAYTTKADVPAPDYADGVIWNLRFSQAGTYRLRAAIPAGVPDLIAATSYKVQFGGQQALKVDANLAASAGGWVDLGAFDFDAGEGQWVRLGDTFVDAAGEGKTVAYDALEITLAGGGAGGSGGGAVTGAGGGASTGSGGAAATGAGGGDLGPGDPGFAGNGTDESPAAASDGCGCRAAGGGDAGTGRAGGLAAIAALAASLRRRRSHGPRG